MKIFVFGNPDVEIDAIAVKIMSDLQEKFPNFEFVQKDPNEDCDIPEQLIVIDTVVGIDSVHVFENLDEFAASPRMSVHGFDALMNLQLLQKLGRLKQIKIIGIAPTISEEKAIQEVSKVLSSI